MPEDQSMLFKGCIINRHSGIREFTIMIPNSLQPSLLYQLDTEQYSR